MSRIYKLSEDANHHFYQIDPTPSPEEIEEYYSQEFYDSAENKFNDSDLEVQVLDKEYWDMNRSRTLKVILDKLSKEPQQLSLLDVGCGWGQALGYFSEAGLKCAGFDPALEAVRYGQNIGLNIKHAGLDTMDVFPGQKFDVVLLNNVLEHLADPQVIIDEIKDKVLADNGILVIDVPNEFNVFQVCADKEHNLGEWWVAPPGHLNYFSASSLTSLLSSAGLDVFHRQASFPMEMFLLFGENYVADGSIGRLCHQKRIQFEQNLVKHGYGDKLTDFYTALADLNLGRQVVIYAQNT